MRRLAFALALIAAVPAAFAADAPPAQPPTQEKRPPPLARLPSSADGLRAALADEIAVTRTRVDAGDVAAIRWRAPRIWLLASGLRDAKARYGRLLVLARALEAQRDLKDPARVRELVASLEAEARTPSPDVADDGPPLAEAPESRDTDSRHGGRVFVAPDGRRVEATMPDASTVRLWLYDPKGRPLSAEGAAADVSSGTQRDPVVRATTVAEGTTLAAALRAPLTLPADIHVVVKFAAKADPFTFDVTFDEATKEPRDGGHSAAGGTADAPRDERPIPPTKPEILLALDEALKGARAHVDESAFDALRRDADRLIKLSAALGKEGVKPAEIERLANALDVRAQAKDVDGVRAALDSLAKAIADAKK